MEMVSKAFLVGLGELRHIHITCLPCDKRVEVGILHVSIGFMGKNDVFRSLERCDRSEAKYG